ncbi:MAG: phosphatidylserine decarboxylase [Endomicrobium sp.]|nr:phosphatidylserine decarboxylase [Endomicrobium sp.]
MKILKEGYSFIGVLLLAGVILLSVGENGVSVVIGILCVLASLFCIYFFRDPEIQITKGDSLILSPCSGTVLEVSESEKDKVIRVFLSVLDVHLQRSPVSGKVVNVEYKPGKFLKAMNPRAHIVNEQNVITIENENGRYFVKQVAGILARRCVSWVKSGDVLKCGDKIGMIKFSSQVDLHIPRIASVRVRRGDKVVAGVTIFATLNC